jgi:hypothetical protein
VPAARDKYFNENLHNQTSGAIALYPFDARAGVLMLLRSVEIWARFHLSRVA